MFVNSYFLLMMSRVAIDWPPEWGLLVISLTGIELGLQEENYSLSFDSDLNIVWTYPVVLR